MNYTNRRFRLEVAVVGRLTVVVSKGSDWERVERVDVTWLADLNIADSSSRVLSPSSRSARFRAAQIF
jgi:hypothetical protein